MSRFVSPAVAVAVAVSFEAQGTDVAHPKLPRISLGSACNIAVEADGNINIRGHRNLEAFTITDPR